MRRLLEGVRVVDFTRVLSGPFCTMILADLGAEVIKIEVPNIGDDVRYFGPFKDNESVYFMNVNRNKKSITLDLRTEKAQNIVWDLIKKSDVIVENFKPGVIKKLGFGYEAVKDVKPEIVYASISGFGQYGPYTNAAAYDLAIQAISGMMSVTGFADKPPVRVGTSISDILSGIFATIGIVSTLYSLRNDPEAKGQYIDVAMLDSAISVMENQIVRYTTTGEVPQRVGSRHAAGGPHNIYRTLDGYIVIVCGNESIWKRLSKLIGREELGNHADYNSMTNRGKRIDEVDSIIEAWTINKTKENAIKLLQELGIPCGAVNSINEVVSDPQVIAREMLREINHPLAGSVKIHGFPIKFSNAEAGVKENPPMLGQHNKEILQNLLGYSEADIQQLLDEKVI